jgi:hypothetical protein
MASLLALGEFAFRVSRQDLATFAVAGVLPAVAAIACLARGRRAKMVDPILALRGEQ